MKTTRILGMLLALSVVALSGCELYMHGGRNNTYTYCDANGCYQCDDYGCWGTGQVPGGQCRTNNDCAGGCFCNSDSVCEETGFCNFDGDCMPGQVCDNRGTCVPPDTNTTCQQNSDCANGQYCDAGVCVGTWTCENNDQCGIGFVCDERGSCVPLPCTTDDQCLEGCYCSDQGTCVETSLCQVDADCGPDLECDTARNTCRPVDPNDPGSCNGPVLCDLAPPSCQDGFTPGIKNGCYTGQCIEIVQCDVPPPPPPPVCADHVTEATCLADAACLPVYAGVNCTDPNGGACEPGDLNCTCERFEFAVCQTRP